MLPVTDMLPALIMMIILISGKVKVIEQTRLGWITTRIVGRANKRNNYLSHSTVTTVS